MIGSRANRFYLLLEAGLLALCLGLAWTLREPGDQEGGDAPPPARTAPAMGNDQAEPRSNLADIETFRNYRERPPFSATRRPPPQPQAEAPAALPAPVVPLQAELVGIVGPPGKRIALLRDQGASDLLRVTAGDRVKGWQVMTVEASRITLQQAGQHQVLEFPRLEGAIKP